MKTTNNQGIETLMGATLTWRGASNLTGEYMLESWTKATKSKIEVWLHDKANGHIITMDLSRRILSDLQQRGEHRIGYGSTIRMRRDAEPVLWITIDNGVAGDIWKVWEEAVRDLQRHVYNTLQDICGCKIHRESATRYHAYFEDAEEWEVSEVIPFDPTNPGHREAYEAQRDRLGLPELITEAEGVKVGDKVLCKCYKTMGIVTGIRFNEGTKTYSYYVNYGKAVKGVNGNYTTGTYGRYGITKNYDQEGREIVGNYEYYRYEIRAGYMLDSDPREYELNGQHITAKMYGEDWRVTLHHSKSPDTTDTMTDHELATLLARLYSAEKAA